MLYDKLMDKENPKVWLLRGMDNITVKILDMIGRAKKSVMLLGALYSEKELETIKEQLASAKKRAYRTRNIQKVTGAYRWRTGHRKELIASSLRNKDRWARVLKVRDHRRPGNADHVRQD